MDLIMRVLGAVVIIIIGIGIWYGIQQYKKISKKQKEFKITALIINRNGTFSLDKLAFLRSDEGMLHMAFQKRKQDKIPPMPYNYVRANQCVLFNYAPGQYAPVDPATWEVVNLNNFNIKLLNNNMKNFAMLEQRAAAGRWAMKQERLKQLTPWITLGIVAIAAAVVSWFILKTASTLFTQATSSRFAECQSICPTLPSSGPPGT